MIMTTLSPCSIRRHELTFQKTMENTKRTILLIQTNLVMRQIKSIRIWLSCLKLIPPKRGRQSWSKLTREDSSKFSSTYNPMLWSLPREVVKLTFSILSTGKMGSCFVRYKFKILALESKEKIRKNFLNCLDLFKLLKLSTLGVLDLV